MKLTEQWIGKKVTRSDVHTNQWGAQDRSYIDSVLTLLAIKENGLLVFEECDTLLYRIYHSLGKPTPREGYVLVELDDAWNDGNWRLAEEGEEEMAKFHSISINLQALAMSEKALFERRVQRVRDKMRKKANEQM